MRPPMPPATAFLLTRTICTSSDREPNIYKNRAWGMDRIPCSAVKPNDSVWDATLYSRPSAFTS